jgi:putative tricarboxylic transport membrane protein
LNHNDHQAAVSRRTMDVVVALLFIAVGVLVVVDSMRVGFRWGSDGPQAGYFPFYIGLIIIGASVANLVRAIMRDPNGVFVERGQLALVMQVLVPTSIFVAAVTWLGMYVSAALFIAVFMGWLGRYPAWKIAPVAIAVPIALFVLFEIWFLVPLPKGPIEDLLGY